MNIVFVDNDAIYLQRLKEVLETRLGANVGVFSSAEELKNWSASGVFESPDLILMSSEIKEEMGEELENLLLHHTVGFFVDSEEEEKADVTGCSYFKYQRAEVLCEKIPKTISSGQNFTDGLKVVVEERKKKAEQASAASIQDIILTREQLEPMRVINCISFCGGVGCTCVAGGIAKYLRKQDKRVAFIGYSVFSGSIELFKKEKTDEAKEFFRLLLSGDDRLSNIMDTYMSLSPEGIWYFDTTSLDPLFFQFGKEDLKKLLLLLRQEERLDYVIIDVGCRLDAATFPLLEVGTNIFLSNGLTDSNVRVKRMQIMLTKLEKETQKSYLENSMVLYSRFNEQNENEVSMIDNFDMQSLGGIIEFPLRDKRAVSDKISNMLIFKKLLY